MKERYILSNILGEDNKEMNRNSYDLYKVYDSQGDLTKAMFYLEKAIHFAVDKLDKLRWLAEEA